MKIEKIAQLLIIVFVLLTSMLTAQNNFETLHDDGAWCWFADPRAIYFQGEEEQTYFSWVNSKGDIVVASYNHKTGVMLENTLHKSFQVDDHANPSVFIRNDGRIMVFYGAHFGQEMFCVISDNVEDISSFGEPINFGSLVTYPYPFYVNNSIYVFFRGGDSWHPQVCISDDNGLTWSSQHLVVSGGGQRPYTRYYQDNTGGIHIAFTHGHPRQESNNKIYYVYFKDGDFFSSDGTFIKTFNNNNPISIDNGDPEVVYDASNGKGWIWDITVDENNFPVMVYAVFPNDRDHRYYYSRWNGTSWITNEICEGGGWFPQTPTGATEPEPNYSGGVIMDSDNPNVVYLSKPINGVFEIWKYTTNDLGVTWDSLAITENTPEGLLNVRPIVPRNHKKGFFDVLWMRGTYEFYTNYNTSIAYQSSQENAREFDFGTEKPENDMAVNYVPDNTIYSGDFGFTDTTNTSAANDAGGLGNNSDFIYAEDKKVFKTDVLNGTYEITIVQGHSSVLYDSMRVVVNTNDTIEIIKTGEGSWLDTSLTVNVTDKMLSIEFSDFGGSPEWLVNSIKVETKEISVDSISLTPKEAKLKILEELELKVSYQPFLLTDKSVVWSVSDTNLASVENGVVTAYNHGSVYVKAYSEESDFADSCLVEIVEPYYLESVFFDIGTATSALAKTARRVSENTLLGNSFGWLDNTGMISRDRGLPDNETRDMVFCPSPQTFRVYLKNNTYPVVIVQGDNGYAHDEMKIVANGKEIASSISANAGQFIETTFDIEVTNGILDITFSDEGGSDANWVVNSISIAHTKPVVGIEQMNFDDAKAWASYKIMDLNGRVLFGNVKNHSNKSLIPENFKSGIYFVSYFDANGRLLEVEKMVKIYRQ